jgi:hypothetical protein
MRFNSDTKRLEMKFCERKMGMKATRRQMLHASMDTASVMATPLLLRQAKGDKRGDASGKPYLFPSTTLAISAPFQMGS